MKLAGLALLLSGWVILVAALPLLPNFGERSFFVAAGLAVEGIGLILLARANRSSLGESQ
jgi:hypothetical protein